MFVHLERAGRLLMLFYSVSIKYSEVGEDRRKACTTSMLFCTYAKEILGARKTSKFSFTLPSSRAVKLFEL